jgi:hypothetical protein
MRRGTHLRGVGVALPPFAHQLPTREAGERFTRGVSANEQQAQDAQYAAKKKLLLPVAGVGLLRSSRR